MTARPTAAASCRAWALACVLLSLTTTACGPAERATAAAPQANPLQFVDEWGMKGQEPGELTEPTGLAVDINNRVYVADRRTGMLQKYEASGVPLLARGVLAARVATAVAVDSGGAIYVANGNAGRVWIHFPDGDLLRNFRVTSQRKADASFGFCVDSDGKIIVPDPAGGRIQVFNSRGRLERAWKLPPSADGKAAHPVDVAAGLDEFVYIADAASGRIAKYTNAGAQVALWDPPAGAAEPLRGIAVSRQHVLVLRGQEPQLEAWSFDGQRLLTESLGSRFEAPPEDLYFAASRDEQVFVLDPAALRILRFRLNLPSP
jgi:streptogramin lyase